MIYFRDAFQRFAVCGFFYDHDAIFQMKACGMPIAGLVFCFLIARWFAFHSLMLY